MKASPMDYESAQNRAYSGRIDAHTNLAIKTGEVILLHYGSPIVTWFQDGRIMLDSCNHLSASTKNRMNAATNLKVFHNRKRPYALGSNMPMKRKIPFYDGITFKDGVLVDEKGCQIQPPTILEFS